MKYCLLFLSIVLITVSACKKVETPKSDDETLQGTNWKLDGATVSYPLFHDTADYTAYGRDTLYAVKDKDGNFNWNHNYGGSYSIYPWKDAIPNCKNDDYLVFRTNHEGGIKTGDVKCPSGEVEEIAFTWGLTDKNSKMYIYSAQDFFFGINNVNAQVKELTDSKLVLAFDAISAKYATYAYRYDTLSYTMTLVKK